MKFKKPIPEAALEVIPIFAVFGVLGLATYAAGKVLEKFKKKDSKNENLHRTISS